MLVQEEGRKSKEKRIDGSKTETADIAFVIALEPDKMTLLAIVLDRDFFLCKSGATSHLTNNIDGMYDLEEISKTVQVGNGNVVKATMVGKIRTTIQTVDSKDMSVVLNNATFMPDLKFNLLSVGKLSKKGVLVTYGNNGAHMKFKDNQIKLKEMGNGNVYGLVIN